MGINQTLLLLFSKLVEYHRTNPKQAMFLAFLLSAVFVKCYRKLRQNRKAIKDKIILITGGAMGIGKLVAEQCKREGAKAVIVWDINEIALADLTNSKIVDCPMKVDVTNKAAVFEAARKVLEKYKYIDILINNAGIVSGKKIQDLTEKDIRLTFDVNVISHFWTLQAFLPIMKKREKGHIVTICSTAGKTGVSFLTDYCASKYACRGLDDSLRHELQDLGHDGIKQTCICPYFINTGMFAGAQPARHWWLRLFVYFLTPERVSNEIVMAIKEEKRELVLPYRLGMLYYLEPILPYFIGDFLIVNSSNMGNFTGRTGNIQKALKSMNMSSNTIGMDLPQ